MQSQIALEPETEPAIISSPDTPVQWSTTLKIAFRFAFCYFGLYCLPFPFGALPYTDKPSEWYEAVWHKVVPWFAQHILHLAQPITIFTNGSGDTTYDYVRALCFLVIAAIVAIAWTVLDRKRANYTRLGDWWRLYIRLTLGTALLSYGAFKVIPSQFPPLLQWRYLETYGTSSPMGILWSFMSASKTYTIFAGAVEVLGGVLLFVPRLATLGALVGIGAMANVFLLNMSYDVPVKLYSFHLLLLSIVVPLPQIHRLTRFFVLNQTTEPARVELRFQHKWANRALVIGQLVLGISVGATALHLSYQQLKSFTSTDIVIPALHGAWNVDEFTVDGQPRTPLITDTLRWQKVIFDFRGVLAFQQMNGGITRLAAKIDADRRTITMTKRNDAKWKADLTYTLPTADTMTMDGQIDGQKVQIKMHHLDGKYLLNTRGFHWINESPLNR